MSESSQASDVLKRDRSTSSGIERRKRSYSTSSNSNSSTSSNQSDNKKVKKSHKKKELREKVKKCKEKKSKRKKEKKKHKEKKKLKKSKRRDAEEEVDVGPIVPDELKAQSKAMAPMTKEDWEKKQSEIKKVFDEETGRYRLIRGEGEIIEEIVSKERHKEINKQATFGDGMYFQNCLKKK